MSGGGGKSHLVHFSDENFTLKAKEAAETGTEKRSQRSKQNTDENTDHQDDNGSEQMELNF